MSQQSQKTEIRKRQTWLPFQFYKNKMKQTSCSHCLKKSHPPAALGRPSWSNIKQSHSEDAHSLFCPQQPCPCPSPPVFSPFQLRRGSGGGPGFATPGCPPAWGQCDPVPGLGWTLPISLPPNLCLPFRQLKFACPSGGLARVGLVSWVSVCWNVGMSSRREDFAHAGDCGLSYSHGASAW